MSWDTVSPGYRPLSWGYPGILRMPPVSHDANVRFQTNATSKQHPYLFCSLRQVQWWVVPRLVCLKRPQNDRLSITRDEGSRRRRALGV